MFVFVFANLLLIPLFFMAHPRVGPIVHDFFVPGIQGGASSTSVLLIIAIVGTTVAPWQLFFQQSNIIDKRITPRWINYERLDTWIGALVVVVGAAILICVSAFAFEHTPYFGHFTDAGGTASGLDSDARRAGRGVLRARAAERVADRRRRAHAVHQLCVRRHVRHQELAAPQLLRRQGLLRDVRADRRRRRGDRADPRRAARA